MKKFVLLVCICFSLFIFVGCNSNYVTDKEVEESTRKVEEIRKDIKEDSKQIKEYSNNINKYKEREKYYRDEYEKTGNKNDLDLAEYYSKKIEEEIFGK